LRNAIPAVHIQERGPALRRRSRFFRAGFIPAVGAVIVGIAFSAVPVQEARAATGCSDCYVVTPAANPATARSGTGEVYAFEVTNNDPHEYLVSLTFTAPTDFVITDATGPNGTAVSALPDSSVTLDLPIEPAGDTFTVDVTALAPCMAASSEVWGVSGVDSLGETKEVKWSSSAPLSVSVTGQCSLEFTGQPAQTAANSDILTGFDSTGSPLTVQLLDAQDDVLNPVDFSASGTPVAVSIQTNPGNGTLSGTVTVVSSRGVADFGNLQINKAGVGYDLAASSPGFTSATSNFFTVPGQIQACTTGSCSASQLTSTTAASVATSSPGNFVTLGLGSLSFTCDHYQAVSDAAAFGVFDASGTSIASALSTVTLTVSASLVHSTHRPLFLWLACYGSQTPFPAIPGTSGTTVIGGARYYTGLLLPCFLFLRGHPQPCLKSRQLTPTGAVALTVIAVGDPIIHT
jgi:hypothetical protein